MEADKVEFTPQIETLPVGKLLRLDHPTAKTAAYFEVHEADFPFRGYNNGSRQMREKYHISEKISKYFSKRNFLFSKFDKGIQIDQESWFSAIPEPVAHHLLGRLKKSQINSVFEPFSGVGGIAIHLCDQFEEYTVSDIDPEKVRMLRANMKVYDKKETKMNFHVMDFLEVEPFQVQALLICPPWGTIDTQAYSVSPLDAIMQPKMSDILVQAMRFTRNLMIQLPKNTNLLNWVEVLSQVGMDPVFTVEKIMTSGKISQLFIYLGEQSFTNMLSSRLNNQIYKDLGNVGKQRKETKRLLKEDCPKVMRRVYEKFHPPLNKHIFFV